MLCSSVLLATTEIKGKNYYFIIDRPLLTIVSVIEEAQRQFKVFAAGNEASIHPSLRSTVFQLAIKNGGASEYEALKKFWSTTTSIDGKELSVRAMGRIESPELLKDYLGFLFGTVAIQDQHTGAAALAINPKTRNGFWKYIKENFDGEKGLKAKLGANMVVLDRFLKLSLQKFSDFETEKEIAAFFDGRDNRGYDRTLGIVSDTIMGRASYRARDAGILLEWLKSHKYA